MKAALALFLAVLATPAASGVTCSKMGPITRCSDGREIERLGTSTVIHKRDPSGILRSTHCDTMGSITRCR